MEPDISTLYNPDILTLRRHFEARFAGSGVECGSLFALLVPSEAEGSVFEGLPPSWRVAPAEARVSLYGGYPPPPIL